MEGSSKRKQLSPSHVPAKTSKQEQKDSLKFRYGNYNRYYGYRNEKGEEDKRVEAMERAWFEGKVCLDVGCNVGHLTLWIAKHFNVSKMKGVDIDCELVKAAKNNIVNYVDDEVETEESANKFPYNVSFVVENFVPASENVLQYVKPQYDVILCMSVTKWVQLNHGDEGLKRMFRKIFKLLRENGVFILEPQPFKSYKRRKNLSDEIRNHYDNIKLVPDLFIEYLLSEEVGFKSAEQIEVTKHEKGGFQRPIFVLKK